MNDRMVKYTVNGMSGILPWLKFAAFCRDTGVVAHPSGGMFQAHGQVGSWSWGR